MTTPKKIKVYTDSRYSKTISAVDTIWHGMQGAMLNESCTAYVTDNLTSINLIPSNSPPLTTAYYRTQRKMWYLWVIRAIWNLSDLLPTGRTALPCLCPCPSLRTAAGPSSLCLPPTGPRGCVCACVNRCEWVSVCKWVSMCVCVCECLPIWASMPVCVVLCMLACVVLGASVCAHGNLGTSLCSLFP